MFKLIFIFVTLFQLFSPPSFNRYGLGALASHQTEGDHEFCSLDQHDSSGCNFESNHEPLEHQQKSTITIQEGSSADGCFRAAVFEHYRKGLCNNIKAMIDDSLGIYDKVAKIASINGANIIIFPEDGIFMGSKNQVLPFLSDIPDPKKLTSIDNNPCLQTKLYKSSEILRNLSCIAKENNLYVVANFGTKQTCLPGTKVCDQICPEIGHFTLNTDVVLDSNGNFIARYRKFNLFIEIFDKSPSLETIFFDSPFGRFGVFTCFDMMFKRPAVELVEDLHIDTAIFPTWWYDELPLLSAIQFQEGWSWTNKVNLLASNIHLPDLGSVGSGIYSGNNSIYTTATADQPILLIANLPKKINTNSTCNEEFKPLVIDIETEEPKLAYKYKQYTLLPSDSVYKLEKSEGKKMICTGQVCCTINYEINPLSNTSSPPDYLSRLVLIARDGRRPGRFNWYEQVCALVTLEKPFNSKSLDQVRYSMDGIVEFKKLSLKGTFNSKYVYPITARNVSELIGRNKREFNCDQLERKTDNLISCKMNYIREEKDKNNFVYSFGMYGRLYDKDKMPEGW